MTEADGFVQGVTPVVNNGPASFQWNLVILSDGFTQNQIPQYQTLVDNFVTYLHETPPFGDLWCGINIYRVDVVSNQAGTDDPVPCADEPAPGSGSGTMAATYFDSSTCYDGDIRRCILVNELTAIKVAIEQMPFFNAIIVFVNTPIDAGCSRSGIGVFSNSSNVFETAVHELGHAAFGLADEYPYLQGSSAVEPSQNNYVGGEPTEPNVTIDTNKNTNKWRDLILPSTNMPTTNNQNCAQVDSQTSPVSVGTVGTFEGAHTFHCGVYRPEFDCKMNNLGVNFCAVCQRQISQTIPSSDEVGVELLTPNIEFLDIPEGVGDKGVKTYRSIQFECHCWPVFLSIIDGPTITQGGPPPGFEITDEFGYSTTVIPSGQPNGIAIGKIWLSYTSTKADDSVEGTVTISWTNPPPTFAGETKWEVYLKANTVPRPLSAISLVLDITPSMQFPGDAYGGTPKIDLMIAAAKTFVSLMLPGDSLGIVTFTQPGLPVDAKLLMPVEEVGPESPISLSSGRGIAEYILTIELSNPFLQAWPIVGDPQVAVELAVDSLWNWNPMPKPGQKIVRALVLITDGNEGPHPEPSDVGILADHMFVVLVDPDLDDDLGLADFLNLEQASQKGDLLISGPIDVDDIFRLHKFFIDILAGFTNAQVVLDPQGNLTSGAQHDVPFYITETDMSMDVILISSAPPFIDFKLRTPDGTIIDPAFTINKPSMRFVLGEKVSYYRVSLPALPSTGSHEGKWHAVLSPTSNAPFGAAGASLRYNFVVHTYSNLSFRAFLVQNSFDIGAEVKIFAILKEYDVPVDHRAHVWAEVAKPNKTNFNIFFNEVQPGEFEGSFTAWFPGIYTIRVRAAGTTFHGTHFTREKILTTTVYKGADDTKYGRNKIKGVLRDHERRLCSLLLSIVDSETIRKYLAEKNINIVEVRKYIDDYCRGTNNRREKRKTPVQRYRSQIASLRQNQDISKNLSEPDILKFLTDLLERRKMNSQKENSASH